MKRLAITLLLSMSLRGQTFEVASVKPHGAARGVQGILPACKDGRFVAVAPVFLVIQWAYNLDVIQFEALRPKLPDWAQSISGSYDLEATYSGQASEDQCRKMMQNLFIERFAFKSHLETAQGAVYNLVLARGGPKMPLVQEGDDSRGLTVTMNGRLGQFLPGAPVPRGLTMDELAQFLSARLTPITPVINKTELPGLYKITLTFTVGAAALAKEFADPDLATAVQQQLGLKLEEGKGPIQHFIVDHIEMPDEN